MSQSGRTPPSTRKERRAAERASHKTPTAAAATKPSPWSSPVVLISIGVVVVAAVLLALLVLSQGNDAGAPIKTVETGTPEELRDGRSLGSVDAPVQVLVFEDPQCPVCGRFTRELEPLLVASNIKDGTVRLTYKDFVFIGEESQDAAVGMRAADQLAGKFWDFHDIVYENQDGENQGAFSRERLGQMAETIGLDKAAFLALLDDPKLIADMQAEIAEAQALGINQTPTLVINGEIKAGLPTWDDLSAAIEAAAAAAGPVATPGASAAPSSAPAASVAASTAP
jgi:protein-disulfide isomerase